MGESAGGGSILQHLTAFGGLNGPAPFQQAILQSPALLDVPDTFEQQQTFDKFLSLLKVNTIAEARKLPASSLITANSLQIARSEYGAFTYGPMLDGRFAPAPAGRLLRQGWFDKNVKIMVSHTANEALAFTNPSATSESAFINTLRRAFGVVSPIITEYIANVLYPPVYNGSYGYTDLFTRELLVVSDKGFT